MIWHCVRIFRWFCVVIHVKRKVLILLILFRIVPLWFCHLLGLETSNHTPVIHHLLSFLCFVFCSYILSHLRSFLIVNVHNVIVITGVCRVFLLIDHLQQLTRVFSSLFSVSTHNIIRFGLGIFLLNLLFIMIFSLHLTMLLCLVVSFFADILHFHYKSHIYCLIYISYPFSLCYNSWNYVTSKCTVISLFFMVYDSLKQVE